MDLSTDKMFSQFTSRHIPPLFIATATTFGGLWPFIHAESAMMEFGFPQRVAISRPAQAVMVVSSARTTTLGLALFMFYYQGSLGAVDSIMVLLGYVGAVDGYVLWKEGERGHALKRGCSGLLIALWGWFGMTIGR
jgi:Domain of unknown function (DUF4267)